MIEAGRREVWVSRSAEAMAMRPSPLQQSDPNRSDDNELIPSS